MTLDDLGVGGDAPPGHGQRARNGAVALVRRRGLTITAEQRRRILGCTDLAMLERWLDRALSVGSVAELLASPARTRRSAHSGSSSAPANGRRKSR